jgi:hypothetical protein
MIMIILNIVLKLISFLLWYLLFLKVSLMLIDIDAPPNDENISIMLPDLENLIEYRWHQSVLKYLTVFKLFVESFTGNYINAARDESIYICKRESNLLIVVCLYFPHLSRRFRAICVKTHWLQQRCPLAQKIFLMVNPTPFLLVARWRFYLIVTSLKLFALNHFSICKSAT